MVGSYRRTSLLVVILLASTLLSGVTVASSPVGGLVDAEIPTPSLAPVLGEPGTASEFGAPGTPVYGRYLVPSSIEGTSGSPEPTVGVYWNPAGPDEVYFKTLFGVGEAIFDDAPLENGALPSVVWTDVSRFLETGSGVFADPILHTDEVTGRTWAGHFRLPTPCADIAFRDADGSNPNTDTAGWTMSAVVCQTSTGDHETIGSGPWSEDFPVPADAIYPRAVYYCAQYPVINGCSTSFDGGLTFPLMQSGQVGTEFDLGCLGIHGHIRVSEEGYVATPHRTCGSSAGFKMSRDNGLTWYGVDVPGGGTPEFDPSMSFSRGENPATGDSMTYFASALPTKLTVNTSPNFGVSWLGSVDVSSFYSGPGGEKITRTEFADIQAGDWDRAAVSFLGATDITGVNHSTCGTSANHNQIVWHYYVAHTFDAGATWDVVRASDDPIQIGPIYSGGFGTGDASCRNLLDFNDMDIDSEGRVIVGFADGCEGSCSTAGQSRGDRGVIIRQATGRTVFSEFDVDGETPEKSVSILSPTEGADVPAGEITISGTLNDDTAQASTQSLTLPSAATGSVGAIVEQRPASESEGDSETGFIDITSISVTPYANGVDVTLGIADLTLIDLAFFNFNFDEITWLGCTMFEPFSGAAPGHADTAFTVNEASSSVTLRVGQSDLNDSPAPYAVYVDAFIGDCLSEQGLPEDRAPDTGTAHAAIDSDSDGIYDDVDICPSDPGPQPHGCPDSDFDGYHDGEDACPATPGVAPAGCPADGSQYVRASIGETELAVADVAGVGPFTMDVNLASFDGAQTIMVEWFDDDDSLFASDSVNVVVGESQEAVPTITIETPSNSAQIASELSDVSGSVEFVSPASMRFLMLQADHPEEEDPTGDALLPGTDIVRVALVDDTATAFKIQLTVENLEEGVKTVEPLGIVGVHVSYGSDFCVTGSNTAVSYTAVAYSSLGQVECYRMTANIGPFQNGEVPVIVNSASINLIQKDGSGSCGLTNRDGFGAVVDLAGDTITFTVPRAILTASLNSAGVGDCSTTPPTYDGPGVIDGDKLLYLDGSSAPGAAAGVSVTLTGEPFADNVGGALDPAYMFGVVVQALSVSTTGPYSGETNSEISISAIPTGGAAPVTCQWSATGATFGASTDCSTTVSFVQDGEHQLRVDVSDSTSETSFATTTVTTTTPPPTGERVDLYIHDELVGSTEVTSNPALPVSWVASVDFSELSGSVTLVANWIGTDDSIWATTSNTFTVGEESDLPFITIIDPAEGSTVDSSFQATGSFATTGSSPSSSSLANSPWALNLLKSDNYQAYAEALRSLGAIAVSPEVSNGHEIVAYFEKAPAGLGVTTPFGVPLRVVEGAEWQTLSTSLTDYLQSLRAYDMPLPQQIGVDTIGPGTPMLMTNGGTGGTICTSAFLFKSEQLGKYFLATAGHCLIEDDNKFATGIDQGAQTVNTISLCYSLCVYNWVGLGLYVELGAGYVDGINGRVNIAGYDPIYYARQSVGANGPGNDFALIELPPFSATFPEELLNGWMPFWGGPTDEDGTVPGGLGSPSFGDILTHHGHGNQYGHSTQDRLHVVSSSNAKDITFHGLSSGGDSGSSLGIADPFRTDGLLGGAAGGVLTHGVGVNAVSVPGIGIGTQILRGLEMVEEDGVYMDDFSLVLEDDDTPPLSALPDPQYLTISSPSAGATIDKTTSSSFNVQLSSTLAPRGGAGTESTAFYAMRDGCGSDAGDVTYLSLSSIAEDRNNDGEIDGDGCGSLSHPVQPVFTAAGIDGLSSHPMTLSSPIVIDNSRDAAYTIGWTSFVGPGPQLYAEMIVRLKVDGQTIAEAEHQIIGNTEQQISGTLDLPESFGGVGTGRVLELEWEIVIAEGPMYFSHDGTSLINLPTSSEVIEDTVQVSIDDSTFAAPTIASGSNPYSATVQTSGLSLGSHTIHARILRDGAEVPFGRTSSAIMVTGQESTPPTADFVYAVDGLSVDFTDASIDGSAPITSWSWDFDTDGTFDSFDQNPIHTFSGDGSYLVTLKVQSDDGEDSISKTIVVSEPVNPLEIRIQLTGANTLDWTVIETPDENSFGSWSYDFEELESGSTTIAVQLRENGEVVGSDSHTVTVSSDNGHGNVTNVAPVLDSFTIIGDEFSNSGGDILGFSWSTHDNNGHDDITSVTVSIDGAVIAEGLGETSGVVTRSGEGTFTIPKSFSSGEHNLSIRIADAGGLNVSGIIPFEVLQAPNVVPDVIFELEGVKFSNAEARSVPISWSVSDDDGNNTIESFTIELISPSGATSSPIASPEFNGEGGISFAKNSAKGVWTVKLTAVDDYGGIGTSSKLVSIFSPADTKLTYGNDPQGNPQSGINFGSLTPGEQTEARNDFAATNEGSVPVKVTFSMADFKSGGNTIPVVGNLVLRVTIDGGAPTDIPYDSALGVDIGELAQGQSYTVKLILTTPVGTPQGSYSTNFGLSPS